MKSRRSRAFYIGIFFFAIGACNGRAQETILYSFTGNDGDANPVAALTFDSKGNLYGTTDSADQFHNMVFRLAHERDGSWSETVLYTFPSENDDGVGLPGGVVMNATGNLFGTTSSEGQYGCGNAFELMPQSGQSWKEVILHQFGATSTDACHSKAGLILDVKGNLYGTSDSGGDHNLGTVFELSPDGSGRWKEQVLWSFSGTSPDGSYPSAGVIFDSKGNLYGTTTEGGEGTVGTAFELMPQTGGTWTEKTLHSFSAAPDGSMPQAGLVLDSKGNLYGTTPYGGKYNATNGIVFELQRQTDGSWLESILHNFSGNASFPSGPDGAFPVAGLVFDSKGNLFGTAPDAGRTDGGVVFELSPEGNGVWSEKILHSFDNKSRDGHRPAAGLVADREGNFYGTTETGGGDRSGTVFEIANPDITAVPAFSPTPGTYTATQKITISDYTQGAKIYFTTNGDEPSAESSDEYSGPIEVKHTETIKAIAVAKGLTNSGLATAKYVIHLPAATPEIAPPANTYHAPKVVTITDATSGAAIYYTINGSNPVPDSGKTRFYRGPFRIYATTTIKAIAVATGRSQSKVASDTITIHLPPAAVPVFKPAGASYASAQTVHISDATPNAAIYYTTNGSTPTTLSTKYSGTGIKVNSNETLKAMAKSPATSASPVASATYTIEP